LTGTARKGVGRVLIAGEVVPITERIDACRDLTDEKLLKLG
jgi:hypothetical protein